MSLILTLILSLALLLFSPEPGSSQFYRHGEGLIGVVQYYKVRQDDSLLEIARRFNLGYNSIIAANPGLNPFAPPPDATVVLPTAWILPDVPRFQGIVINIAEMRGFYFYDTGSVMTFPIGIGDEGMETPVGVFKVTGKISEPAWYVPASIRKERPDLPDIVPPGPDNPLGSHALRLSVKNIFIHGTDKPWGVGRRSTHGCLRLYPEDITRLFKMVTEGASVTIVEQPVKVIRTNGRVFIQVHRYKKMNYQASATALLKKKALFELVDMNKLKKALKDKSGVPEDISR